MKTALKGKVGIDMIIHYAKIKLRFNQWAEIEILI